MHDQGALPLPWALPLSLRSPVKGNPRDRPSPMREEEALSEGIAVTCSKKARISTSAADLPRDLRLSLAAARAEQVQPEAGAEHFQTVAEQHSPELKQRQLLVDTPVPARYLLPSGAADLPWAWRIPINLRSPRRSRAHNPERRQTIGVVQDTQHHEEDSGSLSSCRQRLEFFGRQSLQPSHEHRDARLDWDRSSTAAAAADDERGLRACALPPEIGTRQQSRASPVAAELHYGSLSQQWRTCMPARD